MNENVKNVPAIILATHGRFGEELIRSVEMIMGEVENVFSISLLPGDNPDDYRKRLGELIDAVPEGSILLADLFGGTPSNSVMRLGDKHSIPASTGLNMGMVIEALNMRETCSGKELLKLVQETGRNSVVEIECDWILAE